MTSAALARNAALAAALLVAAGGGAARAAAAVPGTDAKARAAAVAERRALGALAPGGASRARYARALAHVRASVSDLLAIESRLAAAARETGPIPGGEAILLRLDEAYGGANLAATHLGQAIWLLDRGAGYGAPSVSQLRSDVRRALRASRALEQLLR